MYYDPKTQFDESDEALVAQFTAFLTKVVKSAKIDYIRRQRHWNWEISMDKLPDVEVEQNKRWLDAASEHEFSFEEERISKAFSELTLLRQKILELSFIEELSAQEIADQLNCSVKFVYNQKHTALKKLRDILLHGGDDHE